MTIVLHTTFSRKGGRVRSAAKTAANRAKMVAYWTAVKIGEIPAPRRPRKPPEVEEIARRLAPYCANHEIVRLEIFGSVARGEARRGSDVDLIATFRDNPGLGIIDIENAMSEIVGAPVGLVTREAIEDMTNPFRKESINRDRKVIYGA